MSTAGPASVRVRGACDVGGQHWPSNNEVPDNAAGATAIFENHPLERRFRDIHTVTQQLQGQLRHFETVGAWMMGVDTDLSFV